MAFGHIAGDAQVQILRMQGVGMDALGVKPRIDHAFGVEDAQLRVRIELPQGSERIVVERGIEDAVRHAKFLDQGQGGLFDALVQAVRGLDLDVDHQAGRPDEVQHLRKGGDLHAMIFVHAAVEVELPQLGQGHIADVPFAVAAAVDGLVMGDDDPVVARPVNIQFNAIRLGLDGQIKRLQRVFGSIAGSAPVRKNQCFHKMVNLPM